MSWEYRIEPIRDLTKETDDRQRTAVDLNRWSAEGWDLVTLTPGVEEWIAVLRRQPNQTLPRVFADMEQIA